MPNDFWKRFRRNRLAIAGSVIVLSLFVVSLLAPWLAPYDPNAIDLDRVLAPPSLEHPLGTDPLGRDVLSRMIWGAGISLKVGFVASGIAIVIGTLLGALAGYYGRWVDALIMRFVDIMLCFPTFFLILAVVAILEPSIWNIMIVIGLTGWMGWQGSSGQISSHLRSGILFRRLGRSALRTGGSFSGISCPTPWPRCWSQLLWGWPGRS